MAIARRTVSASELVTASDCEARLFHDRQRYRAGLLPTDRVAADLSSAVHDAIMAVHRRMEQRLRQGSLPQRDDVRRRLRIEISNGLFDRRLRPSDPNVAERLSRIDGGIDRVADMILDDAPGWATDPDNGDLLIWVEGPLDHGPAVPAVEVAPGRLVKTRPDVIGLRPIADGRFNAVIRDYKAKGQVVYPEADYGILVRTLWVLREAQDPRCEWFIARRNIQIDRGGIDLEVVNLMFSQNDDEFITRARLSEDDLLAYRERVVATLDRAEEVVAAACVDETIAMPTAFCQSWCPYLNRCEPGMDYVRRYVGEAALAVRLAQAQP